MNPTHARMRAVRHAALITLLASLAACGGQDGASDVAAAPRAHLAISGKPPATITAGSEYTFTPTVSPAEAGRTLAFSIANKPSWASFNSRSGNLAGSPASPGTFSAILIGVTDGKNSTSLPPFTVTVAADPKKASATG